jgi:hypothetical protein
MHSCSRLAFGCDLVVEFWKRIGERFGRVEAVVGRDRERTAGCQVPKHHSIGVVAAAKGNASVRLV